MASRARVALLLGVFALPVALPVHPTEAQGSVRPIFGYGPAPRAYRYPGTPYYRHPPPYYGGPSSPYQPYDDEEARPLWRGGTYRTLCVRLCDGFYFPISSAATQDTLAHDADMCSAGCGSEARLFYHPSIGGNATTAVDLTGMAYSSLPNAFKYRKTLVEGCRCRPQPWSEAEQERHRAYALGQSAGGSRSEDAGPKNAEVIAGDYSRRTVVPGLSGVDDDRAVPRPDPIVRNIEPILPERSLFGADGWGPPARQYGWPGSHRRY